MPSMPDAGEVLREQEHPEVQPVRTDAGASWLEAFACELPRLVGSSEGEQEFAALRMLTVGLSSPKFGKVISRAVAHMPKECCYAEVGTFSGYTLLSAAIYNPLKTCFGIDNYRPDFYIGHADSVKARLKANLYHFGQINATVIESDFKNVTLPIPIGVHVIDGEHTGKAVLEGLAWVEDKLADNAIIIFDDISIGDVYEGVERYLALTDKAHCFKEIFKLHVTYPDGANHVNDVAWNGFSILQFRRNG